MSIVEFLLARIEDDQAAAQAAVGNDGPPTWLQDDADGVYGVRPDVDWDEVCQSHAYGVPNECDFNPTACGISITDDRVLEHDRAEHIARHDPARVLAECAAKRKIVELHGTTIQEDQYFVCGEDLLAFPCDTLRALGSVHTDHPDFDPAWR